MPINPQNKITNSPKKLRVGRFTFSCCEDNMVVMTDIMNDYLYNRLFHNAEVPVSGAFETPKKRLDVLFNVAGN